MKYFKAHIGHCIIADFSQTPRAGGAPSEFVLFKEGEGSLLDDKGTKFLVDEKAFKQIYAKFVKHGVNMVIDYEHQTLSGEKAPAAGWIKELKWVAGTGIVASTDWTTAAANHIDQKEYRYFSPVFFINKTDNRVVEVHSVALTNTPKTDNLDPIVASLKPTGSDERMMGMKNFLKKVAAAIGEPEAGEHIDDESGEKMVEKIKACLSVNKAKADEGADVKKLNDVLKSEKEEEKKAAKDIRDALGMPVDAASNMVVAKIHALKQTGTIADRVKELEAEIHSAKVGKALDGALKTGKVTPANKAWAESYAAKDLEGFEAFLKDAPVIVPVGSLPSGNDIKPGKDLIAAKRLTGDESKIINLFGMTAEEVDKWS